MNSQIQDYLLKGVIPTIEQFPIENYYDLFEMQYLKKWIDNSEINEVNIHEHDFVELKKSSENQFCSLTVDRETLDLSFEIFCSKNGIDWNYSNPFKSVNVKIFKQDFRLTLCHEVLGAKRRKYFFRRRERQSFPIEKYFDAEFKQLSLLLSKNTLIAGDTGSGKTSFLKSLLDKVKENVHIALLEDTKEIFLTRKNATYFQSECAHELKTFCEQVLRISPQKIVLGEMRSHEVVPFILLMTAGHNGLMSTIHSKSAPDALRRLGVLFSLHSKGLNSSWEALMELICDSIDHVVFLKNKKVQHVIEVRNYHNGIILYEDLFRSPEES